MNLCAHDGSAMSEDTDFRRDAEREGVQVRRFRCVIAGHEVFDPPTVQGRGWVPRRTTDRRCDTCGAPLTGVVKLVGARARGPRRCDACSRRPSCVVCGAATTGYRHTCSTTCLKARQAALLVAARLKMMTRRSPGEVRP